MQAGYSCKLLHFSPTSLLREKLKAPEGEDGVVFYNRIDKISHWAYFVPLLAKRASGERA